jgi:hypothetical protein
MGVLWAKSKLEFFYNEKKFAEFSCVTHGVERNYDKESVTEVTLAA